MSDELESSDANGIAGENSVQEQQSDKDYDDFRSETTPLVEAEKFLNDLTDCILVEQPLPETKGERTAGKYFVPVQNTWVNFNTKVSEASEEQLIELLEEYRGYIKKDEETLNKHRSKYGLVSLELRDKQNKRKIQEFRDKVEVYQQSKTGIKELKEPKVVKPKIEVNPMAKFMEKIKTMTPAEAALWLEAINKK